MSARLRRTAEERRAMALEALARARSGMSFANWPAIVAGFGERGIPEDDIKPRENVLTFHAWRALGRTVRRGEHGVRVLSYVTYERKDDGAEPGETSSKDRIGRRPVAAYVFHVSQTDPLDMERVS
jgi:hypothetical protein